MLYPIQSETQPHWANHTAGWPVRLEARPSTHCAWSLRKELHLLFCTIFRPTWIWPWGSKVCRRKCTNGRQAPEDPILVLLWRIITYYLRKTLYYNYICNYKMWKFQLIFQQPYLRKCHYRETSTWEIQARCYSLLAPIVMQREW